MNRFGLVGSFTAQLGQRDALVTLLLEAASTPETFPDCELWMSAPRRTTQTPSG